MKHINYATASVVLLGLLIVAAFAWRFRLMTVQSRPEQSAVIPSSAKTCQSNIALQISRLTSDAPEANQSVDQLLVLAKGSAECRNEIVSELIRAMNKPNLNFVADRPSYFLWSHGAAILGELKAVEALDLLIDHLDLNDGLFSASMAHQPAVRGVQAMGVVAIPKLGIALKNNVNRNVRLAAALCLVDIGGAEAMDVLEQSLKSESDPCVRRFILLSIESLDDRKQSKPRLSAKDAEVLQQRLLAFRCDN